MVVDVESTTNIEQLQLDADTVLEQSNIAAKSTESVLAPVSKETETAKSASNRNTRQGEYIIKVYYSMILK